MDLFSNPLEGDLKSWSAQVSVLLIIYWMSWAVYCRTLHPLAHIPGPVWPSISRTYLMYRMYVGDYQLSQEELHKQYGPLIRIAPNELAYADPNGVPLIYRIGNPLEKTDWYHTWKGAGLKSQIDMFTITNEKKHTAYRRIVGGVYSLSSILKNEQLMDQNVDMFVRRLGEFADRAEEVDFGLWLEMYAYDNIGSVFFGNPFGFLEHSTDHGNYIAAVHKAMPLLSVMTHAPSYFRPVLMVFAAFVPALLRAVISIDGIRKTAVRETDVAMARGTDSRQNHMLSQLLRIVEEKGEKTGITHHEVTGEMWVAVMAGADSTAGGLRAVFYHLLKTPSAMSKLVTEIDQAYSNGTLTHPAQHSQATSLPYLMDVCKEAARIWPSFQVIMPRYAPTQGLQLPNDVFVPGGYRIGMNPFVVQRNTDVFGADAGVFRPERWIEANEDQLRRMNAAMLSFGAGTRTCTGQHLAMAEIYKIVPEILRRFTVSMPEEREWTTFNASFNLTSGVVCKIGRRGFA